MLEFHLWQRGFTYSTWGPFPKHRERIKKFKETGDLNCIYKGELDKTCFVAYTDSKDLTNKLS